MAIHRKELAEIVHRVLDSDVPIDDFTEIVDSTFEVLGSLLVNGDTVVLQNFGKFVPHHQPKKISLDLDGNYVEIRPRKRIGFTTSKTLKKRLVSE